MALNEFCPAYQRAGLASLVDKGGGGKEGPEVQLLHFLRNPPSKKSYPPNIEQYLGPELVGCEPAPLNQSLIPMLGKVCGG